MLVCLRCKDNSMSYAKFNICKYSVKKLSKWWLFSVRWYALVYYPFDRLRFVLNCFEVVETSFKCCSRSSKVHGSMIHSNLYRLSDMPWYWSTTVFLTTPPVVNDMDRGFLQKQERQIYKTEEKSDAMCSLFITIPDSDTSGKWKEGQKYDNIAIESLRPMQMCDKDIKSNIWNKTM